MRYTLDHVVIAVPDVPASTAAYCTQFEGHMLTRTSDAAWLYHGDPVLLALHQSAGSPGIHHLAYRVDDAHAACADLTRKGVPVAWDLTEDGPTSHCGFYDPDGLPFAVVGRAPGTPCWSAPAAPMAPSGLRLHHVNILTHDVRRAIRFYEQILGLRVALTYRPDFGGFNFLIDPAFDQHTHAFVLELTGPPDLDARETAYLAAHGPSYDHLCFCTADPAGAYRRLIAAGAPALYEPEELYDTVLAWVEDPHGVQVELMKPLRDDWLAGVLRGEPPRCLTACG